ncbi:MAG TPA: preprotein translocase subunit SecA, partial [Patescibacteria group bacterium]|nr:preprotein translocase subunit SecA [Patescibacteria group bacterium]
FFSKLFDENAKTIKRYEVVIGKINALEPSFKKIQDTKLKAKTAEFKKRVEDGTSLDSLLPEAYALVREAARRTLNMRHYDVQMMAGIAFHEGKVAEQKTGEGKTLSATLPLYLNALAGKGVHLVTVNDYLAQLGAGWMGPIFHALGISVGVIVHDKAYIFDPDFRGEERGDDRLEHFRLVTRVEAYNADVTYGTNNEFGFDYLRDNMVTRVEDLVQRNHYFAIVDEADSILIDEARTPLIISAPDSEPTKKYYDFAKIVETLTKDADYAVDEKMKTATLTDLGVKRIEKKLGVTNLYEESFDVIHHVEQALRSKTLFQRDKDYIVRDGEVIIVDEHTGRLMYGRRYSDGLHQAIEAKENVKIQQESRTLATISLQNYFRLYKKLSGMTGTAATESEEFKKIYNMEVIVVPTHVQVQRIDHQDVVYKTTSAKYSAIVREIEELHTKHQPILIGTRSIKHNDIISEYLERKGVTHQVLNAKNHEKEAFIIANAGLLGAVTVATNIAGRGVDIVLGGSKPERKDYSGEKSYEKDVARWQKNHEKVVSLGGLHVIGTERHESRRIDNQLRGRSGRQGDNGSSRFFLSLEDEIMRLFGGEQISRLMEFLKIDETQPIEHGMIGKAIEQAQVKVEGFFFDQRKRLVEFDDVMNKQREIIYARRKKILFGEKDLKDDILTNIRETISSFVSQHAPESGAASDDNVSLMMKEFISIIPFDETSQQRMRKELAKLNTAEAMISWIQKIALDIYEQREQSYGPQIMREIERFATLSSIDQQWMDHLDNIENLREGIWLRGDKQTVLAAYKQEAFEMFENLMGRMNDDIVHKVYRIQANVPTERMVPQQAVEVKQDVFGSSIAEEAQQAQKPGAPKSTKGSLSDLAQALAKAKGPAITKPGIAAAKIGRNDPCPCGSGKKYKKCHGKNE